MILYFSGTGNSKYVAENLLEEGECLISISDLMRNKNYSIKLESGEPLGIIFPVYFYTVPSNVREFLEKVEINNSSYIYSIITCGGGTGQASAVLQKCLNKRGLKLAYFKEILMPDNSMLFYQIPGVDKADYRLDASLALTKEIKKDINNRVTTKIKTATFLSDLVGLGYKLCQSTNKFYATDTCIGCGLCERNCPLQVIKIENTKPVWKQSKCCKCSACINSCPLKAIQYGKGTIKRNRYVNPRVNA